MIIIGLIKTITGIFWLLAFLVYSSLVSLFFINNDEKRKFYIKTTSWFSEKFLKIIGMSVIIKEKDLEKIRSFHGLIVSNHLSYLDILILSSLKPSIFVSSVEVEKTLFLGKIAKIGGSIFVERRSKSSIINDIQKLSSTLKKGFSITLFPEGTTSNGEKILKFKKSLFNSAIESKVSVLPICIKYLSINKNPITEKNRDKVYYYGSIKFAPHFFKLFFAGKIEVKVKVLSPIDVNKNPCRKELTEKAYEKISFAYAEI